MWWHLFTSGSNWENYYNKDGKTSNNKYVFFPTTCRWVRMLRCQVGIATEKKWEFEHREPRGMTQTSHFLQVWSRILGCLFWHLHSFKFDCLWGMSMKARPQERWATAIQMEPQFKAAHAARLLLPRLHLKVGAGSGGNHYQMTRSKFWNSRTPDNLRDLQRNKELRGFCM